MVIELGASETRHMKSLSLMDSLPLGHPSLLFLDSTDWSNAYGHAASQIFEYQDLVWPAGFASLF